MRLPLRGLAIVGSLSTATIAHADDSDYPTAIIDRPLVLPPAMYEPYAAFMYVHDSAAVAPAPSSSDFAIFGLDTGIAKHFQVGAFTNVKVSNGSELERAMASAQYQLLAFAALRVDAGVQRVGNGDLYAAFGVGLPVRLKLTEMLALISGRPYAYGAEGDIFSVRVGGSTISELRIPIGLLVQLDQRFSVAARSGYRMQGSATYVPLGADITAALGPLDVGVTLDVDGQIGPANGNGYADIVTVRGWAQLRL